MGRGAAACALTGAEGPTAGEGPISTQTTARRAVALVAVVAEAFDEPRRVVTVRVDGERVDALLDATVDAAVVHTALRRHERLVAQPESEGWVVVGALRTSATPGVDEGDEFLIKARRVAVVVAHEFNVVTGAASFAMRAIGHVETLAQDITTRAASVHKLVGRMIRLN